jgi:hypothetical protein
MIETKGAIVFVILILTTSSLHGQERHSNGYRYQNYFDLAASAGSGTFSAALSWSHLHGIGKKKQRLKVGYGLRFTSFVAANKYYTTAPSKYTSSVQSIGTIFSETILENIDTISTATASVHSLNVAIQINYSITPKIDVGLNIDAVGFSFGPEKTFNIISSVYDENQEPVQRGAPTTFNLLLTSDNDIGSLNSEFFLRYWLTTKIGVRAGYTFLFSEYQTTKDLSFDDGRIVNDRFRYKSSMALVAVTFKPFN